MIHVFGDSHSWMFRDVGIVHHTGTQTMHRIGMEGVPVQDSGLSPGDTIVATYGEIDCRCHFGRIADATGIRLHNIVKPTVMLYCIHMAELDRAYAKRTIVSCIVPPSNRGDAPTVPFHGTLSDRVAITLMANRYLRSECNRLGLTFLDFYDRIAISDGSLNPELSDGLVHVAEKHYGIITEAFGRLR